MNLLHEALGWKIAFILTAVFLFQATSVYADSTAEHGVKIGFVYNFAKFIEWPSRVFATVAAPLRLCVLGEAPLNGKLRLLSQRQAQGRSIDVTINPPARDWRSCHMLYLGADETSQLKAVQRILDQAPVLTISDIPNFAHQGGIIELYIENDRVQFAINLTTARRAGLKLNAQMLRMAKIVE
ncbi:MAG: YfiR family protein [Gammaproteobacteria bacterium]|nr:YfiR family protein [Gammaproteobacteria bacterium]